MKRPLFATIVLTGAIVLSACSNASTDSPTPEPTPTVMEEEATDEQPAEEAAASDGSALSETDLADEGDTADTEAADTEMAETEAAQSEEAEQPVEVVADLAPWQTLPLVDARSGEAFTFANFAGKTVFVEPMATWCGNCRRQLGNVKEASAQVGGDDVVFVALSVETNIPAETLASYADDAGFDWTFAVMTPQMLQELSGDFGQTISNPPATPHFIIRPDGSTTDLVTGIEPANDIVAQIEAARG